MTTHELLFLKSHSTSGRPPSLTYNVDMNNYCENTKSLIQTRREAAETITYLEYFPFPCLIESIPLPFPPLGTVIKKKRMPFRMFCSQFSETRALEKSKRSSTTSRKQLKRRLRKKKMCFLKAPSQAPIQALCERSKNWKTDAEAVKEAQLVV